MNMSETLRPARAYYNHGRWVADCPRPECTYAFALELRQDTYVCATRQGQGCRMAAPVEWPDEAEEIQRVLDRRPVEATRNWFPGGHMLAVLAGSPHGQTVEDLLAENNSRGVK